MTDDPQAQSINHWESSSTLLPATQIAAGAGFGADTTAPRQTSALGEVPGQGMSKPGHQPRGRRGGGLRGSLRGQPGGSGCPQQQTRVLHSGRGAVLAAPPPHKAEALPASWPQSGHRGATPEESLPEREIREQPSPCLPLPEGQSQWGPASGQAPKPRRPGWLGTHHCRAQATARDGTAATQPLLRTPRAAPHGPAQPAEEVAAAAASPDTQAFLTLQVLLPRCGTQGISLSTGSVSTPHARTRDALPSTGGLPPRC